MFRALRFARAPSAATFARSSLFSLALATLVACLTECGAGAAPAPVTLFSTAVCTAPGDQSDPQVVSDGGGGAVVVWVDRRGADADVYASHLLVSGVRDPAWPVDGLALCAAGGDQLRPRVVFDGDHGFVVAWEDARRGERDVYAQRVSLAGVIDPAWPAGGLAVCAADSDQTAPTIVTDGARGAIVVWEDARGESGTDLYAQHVLASGALDPGWPAAGAIVDASGDERTRPLAVSDGAGGAIVVFLVAREFPPPVPAILARRVLASGVLDPEWPADGVPTGGLRPPFDPMASALPCSDGEGGVFVISIHESILSSVVVDHVSRSGIHSVYAGHQASRQAWFDAIRIADDGRGGYVASWVRSYDAQGPPPEHQWERHYELFTHGSTMPGSVAPIYVGEPVRSSAVATDGADGVLIAWRSEASDHALRLHHVFSNGEFDPACPPGGKWLSSTAGAYAMVSDGAGGATIAWEDSWRGEGLDLYAYRSIGAFPTEVTASLIASEVASDVVRLTWLCPESRSAAFEVERAPESGAWTRLASGVTDAAGRAGIVDRDVRPGTRLGYRLALRDGDRDAFVGETWLDVPSAPALAISCANPVTSAVPLVRVSLPGCARGALELFDTAGRRRAHVALDALGAGSHAFPLGAGAALPAGVYVVRLTHGDRSLAARIVIVR